MRQWILGSTGIDEYAGARVIEGPPVMPAEMCKVIELEPAEELNRKRNKMHPLALIIAYKVEMKRSGLGIIASYKLPTGEVLHGYGQYDGEAKKDLAIKLTSWSREIDEKTLMEIM